MHHVAGHRMSRAISQCIAISRGSKETFENCSTRIWNCLTRTRRNHHHQPRVFCVPAKSAEAKGGKAEKFLQHTFKEAFRLFLTFITRYNFSWPYACGVRTRCRASSSRRAHFKNFHLGTRGLPLTQLSARIHFPHCSVLTFYYIFRTVRCDNFVFYYIGSSVR